jgi:hypothetical protein
VSFGTLKIRPFAYTLLARFEVLLAPRKKVLVNDPPIYSWQPTYLSAVLETNNDLMPSRIYEALAAIEQRLLNPKELGCVELKAIEDAQTGLLTLKAERTGDGIVSEGVVIRAEQHSEETC